MNLNQVIALGILSVTKPEEWVENYGDYLYRYALIRLNDVSAATDVVQEAFLAGIKEPDSFDGRVEMKYWLRGILKNKIVDQIRKNIQERHTEDLKLYDEQPTRLRKHFGIASRYVKKWSFDSPRNMKRKSFGMSSMRAYKRSKNLCVVSTS